MAYTYTYNPLAGLSAGISMIIGAANPHHPNRMARPHLRIDAAGSIALNRQWNNAQIDSGKLLRSSITTIESQNGRPFNVFDAPRQDDDFHSMIFIDTSVPKGMKRRPETEINAWTEIRGRGFKTLMRDRATNAALLYCEPNATIKLLQFDGSVHLLSVVGGKVSTVPLTQKEMAQARVEQFEEQIAAIDLSQVEHLRYLHGIIGGALRLAKVTKDRDALDVLVNFFVTYQAQLTDNLRKQIRWVLTDAGHPAASTFLDGFEAGNVVRMQNPDGAAKRAAALAKKRERAQRESAACLARKGKSGGNSHSPGGKKGKKAA